MGVKPMSPSANFTTYNLPPSRSKNEEAFGHHSYSVPRPKQANNNSLFFRFLLCSRPCFHQQSVDVNEDHHDDAHSADLEKGDLDSQDFILRMELQSVMRHLEVRWQLFDEALSRFGDLEAMLAICAEKSRWKHYTADGVKEAHITEDLKSLIDRKLSMVVSINSITQLFASGELGTSFGDEISKNGVQVQAALDLFNETRQDWSRIERNYVLEQDTYVLCNHKGEVVEEGTQVVIWEQYNSTWYIRGCVSYPSIADS